jgi:hypothetical protein
MTTISTTTPHPSARAAADTRLSEAKTLRQMGFWSAFLSALFGIGFDLAVVIMYTSLPKTDSSAGWTGITSYLETFDSVLLLPLVPSLLLVPAFTAMMVCIHYYAPPEKRIWSHLGLAFALIYAVMAFMNYSTQLLSVQRAILAGETDGLAMLVHGNPHAIFWSLVSGYIFMNLAMLFAAPVFACGKLEIWTHRFFLLNGASVVLTTVSVCIDNPLVFNLLSVIVWSPLVTIATSLLAVLFARLDVHNKQYQE